MILTTFNLNLPYPAPYLPDSFLTISIKYIIWNHLQYPSHCNSPNFGDSQYLFDLYYFLHFTCTLLSEHCTLNTLVTLPWKSRPLYPICHCHCNVYILPTVCCISWPLWSVYPAHCNLPTLNIVPCIPWHMYCIVWPAFLVCHGHFYLYSLTTDHCVQYILVTEVILPYLTWLL